MTDRLNRALRAFDADAFAARHGGYKESRSSRSREWLLPHRGPRPDGMFCGSDRLRWHHEPGRKMAWICWGCGKTGDTLDLVALLERTDRTGAIAVVVDGYSGGDAPTELVDVARVAQPTRILDRLPAIPWPAGVEILDPRVAVHAPAFQYLVHERGLTLEQIAAYRIGYSRIGRLARYVVFPCFMDGQLVYWQGRATWDPPRGLAKDARKAWEKATRYRKTLNPYGEESGGTGSTSILFGYDEARRHEHVVVVEGPIDAIRVGPHAVAMFGKEPSPEKTERLLRMAARCYTVYLDRGEEEHERALRLAMQLSSFAPTSIATPPEGYDPGKLTPAQNAAVIAAAVPLAQFGAGLRSRLRVV